MPDAIIDFAGGLPALRLRYETKSVFAATVTFSGVTFASFLTYEAPTQVAPPAVENRIFCNPGESIVVIRGATTNNPNDQDSYTLAQLQGEIELKICILQPLSPHGKGLATYSTGTTSDTSSILKYRDSQLGSNEVPAVFTEFDLYCSDGNHFNNLLSITSAISPIVAPENLFNASFRKAFRNSTLDDLSLMAAVFQNNPFDAPAGIDTTTFRFSFARIDKMPTADCTALYHLVCYGEAAPELGTLSNPQQKIHIARSANTFAADSHYYQPASNREPFQLKCGPRETLVNDPEKQTWCISFQYIGRPAEDGGDINPSKLWRNLVYEPYVSGLERLRQPKTGSFILDLSMLHKFDWWYRFDLNCDDAGTVLNATWKSLILVADQQSEISMPSIFRHDGDPINKREFKLSKQPWGMAGEEIFRLELRDVTQSTVPGSADCIRVGALDLKFGNIDTSYSISTSGIVRVNLLKKQGRSEPWAITEIQEKLSLWLAEANPGSQDDSIGTEDAFSLIRDRKPLCWPIKNSPVLRGPLLLEVNEESSKVTTRKLELFLRIGSDSFERAEADLIVLDFSPFCVSRVVARSGEQQKGTIIASYKDIGADSAQWEWKADQEGFTILLPPGVMGEEVVKSGGHVLPAPDTAPHRGRSFDYRFSPPVRFALRKIQSDLDKARTPLPWNLRRLLGYAGTSSPGAELSAMEFELLYGLTAFANTKGLRITELEALVGRFVLDPDVLDIVQQVAQEAELGVFSLAACVQSNDQKNREFAKKYFECLKAMSNRFAHWIPFRAGEERKPFELLTDNVHRVRPTRTCASLDTPFNKLNGELLQGGFDWLFESRNILTEVLGRPVTNDGELANLSFSARGASGIQKSVFGKSEVDVSTTEGRNQNIQVLRYGRISCTWNLARHVIVHERTPISVADFKQSDAYDGIHMMRKVDEYIEILEQCKDYRGQADATNGFVAQCNFVTTKIRVLPEWGHDFSINGFEGWMIPLYDSQANSALKDPIPKPVIQLALHSPTEDEGVRESDEKTILVHRRIENCEILKFYSLTNQPDVDVSMWPVVPGIDCPLSYVRPPKGSRKQSPGKISLPDADEIEVGLEDFTFQLENTTQFSDVLKGRQPNSMQALIQNVSLCRAQPPLSGISKKAVIEKHLDVVGIGSKITDTLAQIYYVLNEAEDGWRIRCNELIAEVISDDVRDLLNACYALSTEIPELDWDSIQRSKTDVYFRAIREKISKSLQEATVNISQVLLYSGNVDEELNSVVTELNRVIIFSLSALEIVAEKAQSRVKEARSFTGNASKQFVFNLEKSLRRRFDEAVSFLNSGVSIDDILPQLMLSLQSDASMMYSTLNKMDKRLHCGIGRYFARIEVSSSTSDVRTLFQGIETSLFAQLSQWKKDILAAPDPDAKLRAIAFAEVAIFTASIDAKMTEIDTTLSALSARLDGAVNIVKAEVRRAVSAATTEINRILTSGNDIDVIRSILTHLAYEPKEKVITDTIVAISTNLRNEIVQDRAHLLGNLTGLLSSSSSPLTTFADKLKIAANSPDYLLYELVLARRTYDQVFRPALTTLVVSQFQNLEHETAFKSIPPSSPVNMLRAFGDAPKTELMEFAREKLAYYFEQGSDVIGTTPCAVLLNKVDNEISALGAAVPFTKIGGRVLPDIANFKLGDILPDFGGLKLEKLLPTLKLPDEESLGIGKVSQYNWLKISHGINKSTHTAWALCEINKEFPGRHPLFEQQPLAVFVQNPRFRATSRVEISQSGSVSRLVRGGITADWVVRLSGLDLISLCNSSLDMDNDGHFSFQLKPRDIRFPGAMEFLVNQLQKLAGDSGGLSIERLESGLRALISAPLPDLTGGVFSITGVSLSVNFDVTTENDFTLGVGFWLSRKASPFNLSILCLGGGGWFGLQCKYSINGQLAALFTVGIAAGATMAINLGPASGKVSALFYIEANYEIGANSKQLRVILGFMVSGELRILGIASARLSLSFEMEYLGGTGSLTGTGLLDVSIEICWCFTLSIRRTVRMTLRKGKPPSRILFANDIPNFVDQHFASIMW